jgi:asparagine synthase (glutamine-hydrolysing)
VCGIAGIATLNGRPVKESEIRRMTGRMMHRGPDDDGFFTEDSVGIGMRRLSIIDVSGGQQPLSNEASDCFLVLNGEIYNHVELRRQLVSRGHVFRTKSDAEVVLHLYEDHGKDALTYLNGMFAFALYDSRRRALWIARDRLGVKPLFYAMTSDRLAFASDVNALRMAHTTDVAADQVIKYLGLGYAPGVETVWRDVHKLPPAHYMWIEGRDVAIQRYWSLEDECSWSGTQAAADEELAALLGDAVNLQLRSDVPLGVFLSGGLDSSSIVALASEQLTEPLRTFTVRFEGKKGSDQHFANEVAQRYETRHEVIPMDAGDAARSLDELIPLLDEPIADSAIVPAYFLSKAGRARGMTVLLNGAGGDEVFAGYSRHWPAPVASPAWCADNVPAPLRRILVAAWSGFQPDRAARAIDPTHAWAAGISGINFVAARRLLKHPADYALMLDAIRVEHAGIDGAPRGHDGVRRKMRLDLNHYLPENVLSLTDKATMAASVEGRVPLLDHRLIEFAFALPPSIALPGNEPKGLLKRAMRGRLSEGLLGRGKEGFNAPDAVWLNDDAGFDLRGELLDSRTEILDSLLDVRALEATLASPDLRSRSSALLFALYLFNRWYRVQDPQG